MPSQHFGAQPRKNSGPSPKYDYHISVNNFNGAQVSALLNDNWNKALIAAKDNDMQNNDLPIFYKSTITTNPWAAKKGAKLASGADLLVSLRESLTPMPNTTQVKKPTSHKKRNISTVFRTSYL